MTIVLIKEGVIICITFIIGFLTLSADLSKSKKIIIVILMVFVSANALVNINTDTKYKARISSQIDQITELTKKNLIIEETLDIVKSYVDINYQYLDLNKKISDSVITKGWTLIGTDQFYFYEFDNSTQKIIKYDSLLSSQAKVVWNIHYFDQGKDESLLNQKFYLSVNGVVVELNSNGSTIVHETRGNSDRAILRLDNKEVLKYFGSTSSINIEIYAKTEDVLSYELSESFEDLRNNKLLTKELMKRLGIELD